MFIAGRHVERRVVDAVHAAGHPDLTLAMTRLAARINEDGSRLTDLADAAGVTKQTAHVLVEQRVARRVEADVLREWEEHLGAPALEQLTDSLTRLREITDLAP